ncbi:DegT/DnrJ/EryC1/StrS family aminotransferase [Arundinibacter roseus]|uniref:DegT/DnrJ/EryC1/StrS family aminotransferase n=1 Tax=Arundinibacter roseus TaxID=2070510 RepID=A0A4R4KMR1_9BACT|nr:DegT/DnrJ/EryC1/StrS family aminotransferase [Arundinibacter roseus]TDB67969.1 DegT/DnrJ/EryC1/StrS family aminotransferase [Arundinibacter roseus]
MIPFLDLQQLNAPHQAAIETAVQRVVRSGWYILGQELTTFEKSFADYCEASHCVGVANGLDALQLILQAYDFPKDSEVIVPANTYIASVLSISFLGLVPVFVEPDPKTMLLDPARIEEKITYKTKAVLPVHLYGRSCEMAPVQEIASRFGLKIVTDCAQSHGATYAFSKKETLGDAAAFSFYPTKNLGALGDAGAVVTSDAELAKKIRYLRNYGSNKKYFNEYQGVNSRLDEMQAAVLNAKLPFLDRENQHRRELAQYYLNSIQLSELVLPPADRLDEDVWHLFVVRHPRRAAFIDYLLQCGIQTNIHYPLPIHHQKAYQQYSHLRLPITEQIHQEVVSLPLSPVLSLEQVAYICDCINQFKG